MNRTTYIGGSDAAAIAGVDPYRTELQVWFEKIGEIVPDDISEIERVRWGVLLEPIIAEEYARRMKCKVRRNSTVSLHPQHRFIGGHYDGYITLPNGQKGVLECKTAGGFAFDRGEWGEEYTDQVPRNYYMQCQHYLLVSGRSFCDAAVLVGGQEMLVYHIEADEELHESMIQLYLDFWHKVENKIRPATDYEHDSTNALLSQVYPESNGERIELPPELIEVHEEQARAKAALDQWKAYRTARTNRLKEAIGNASVLDCPDGSSYRKIVDKNGRVSFKFEQNGVK